MADVGTAANTANGSGPCAMTKKNGEPCKKRRVLGEDYCAFHLPANQADRRLHAVQGGKARANDIRAVKAYRRLMTIAPEAPRSMAEIACLLDQAMDGVLAGSLPIDQAQTLADLIRTRVKVQEAITVENLERKVIDLEVLEA